MTDWTVDRALLRTTSSRVVAVAVLPPESRRSHGGLTAASADAARSHGAPTAASADAARKRKLSSSSSSSSPTLPQLLPWSPLTLLFSLAPAQAAGHGRRRVPHSQMEPSPGAARFG
jgi:hypothetical protein